MQYVPLSLCGLTFSKVSCLYYFFLTLLSFKTIINQKKKREWIDVYLLGFPGGSEVKVSAWNAGDTRSIPGLGRSLEKEMVTHSSILAWRIPWTEEPGRLQSMGSQRVRHD